MKRHSVKTIIFSALVFVLSAISLTALSACNGKKITAGKYYAENNAESYIEILENNQILFVNVDFSKLNETLEAFEIPMTADDVAQKFGEPQNYETTKGGGSVEGYDYTLHVLVDGTEEDGGLSLTVRWAKPNVLLCLGLTYVLN